MDVARQALFRALRKGDATMLAAVIAQGALVTYEAGDPGPVFLHALSGEVDEVRLLTLLRDAGGDAAAVSREDGRGGLHWSVGRTQPDALYWFLEQGLDVNLADSDGVTPLMAAITAPGGRAAVVARDVRALLEAGADAGRTDSEGRSALHLAAAAGLSELILRLIAGGAGVDARDALGATPLLYAVEAGQLSCVERLMDAGADVTVQAAGGFDALHALAATEAGQMTAARLAIAERLLARGVDVDAADGQGRSALCWAAAYDHGDMADMLLRHGAGPDADGGYALREAVAHGRSRLAALLLSAGARTDLAEVETGNQVLHTAAEAGDAGIVEVLLDHGAQIEARNADGETALLVAARRGQAAVVEALMRRGADAQCRDAFGSTPQAWVERRR